MKKWEYKITWIPDSVKLTSIVSRLGAEGWELVSVVKEKFNTAYYFKREIESG